MHLPIVPFLAHPPRPGSCPPVPPLRRCTLCEVHKVRANKSQAIGLLPLHCDHHLSNQRVKGAQRPCLRLFCSHCRTLDRTAKHVHTAAVEPAGCGAAGALSVTGASVCRTYKCVPVHSQGFADSREQT